jgi:hypothetical protein
MSVCWVHKLFARIGQAAHADLCAAACAAGCGHAGRQLLEQGKWGRWGKSSGANCRHFALRERTNQPVTCDPSFRFFALLDLFTTMRTKPWIVLLLQECRRRRRRRRVDLLNKTNIPIQMKHALATLSAHCTPFHRPRCA